MQVEVIKHEELGRNASATEPRRLTLRTIALTFFCVCLLLVVVAYAFTRPLEDFVEYWTAGHLLVHHRNPYALAQVFRFEQALGWRQPIPLIALNPPWTLAFFAPLGFFQSYWDAWLAWVVVMILASGLSSRLLMDLYFGDLRLEEISDTTTYRSLFALTFYPVLLSLKFGQIVPLVLLGSAACLFFFKRQQPILAGVALALTAIKPNLVYLVWLALLLWSIRRRQFKTLASAATLISVLLGIALAIDPHALSQYRALASSPLPLVLLPGFAGALRSLFPGHDLLWLQMVPPLVGIGWFAFYWSKYRDHWNWTERMPALVAASILTTAYGWLFDQTLLAVPIIALAGMYAKRTGRLPRNLVALYTVLNVTLILLAMASTPWSFVPAPIVVAFLLYREARAGSALSSSVRYTFAGNPS